MAAQGPVVVHVCTQQRSMYLGQMRDQTRGSSAIAVLPSVEMQLVVLLS